MAKLDPMGIVGRVGDLIHYRVGKNYFVRAAPRKFKQTKATKARASEFGRASTISSTIRKQLRSVIPNVSERKMRGRLLGLVFQWLSSKWGPKSDKPRIGKLIGFSFSETKNSIRERWKSNFQVNFIAGLVELRIPEFIPEATVQAPKGTGLVVCKIAVGVCNISNGAALGNFSTELSFNYNNKTVAAQIISMKLPMPKGSLIVVGMNLEYMISESGDATPITNIAYMPAEIVDAKFMATD